MRNILGEFGYNLTQPTTLHMDNQSAISVSKNPEHHGRMKHLDLRYYWLRDTVGLERSNLCTYTHLRWLQTVLQNHSPGSRLNSSASLLD